jgi:hypothetical protein
MMAKTTKLKQKVIDMWAYLKTESTTNPNKKIDNGLIQMALRQATEYEKTKEDDKAAAANSKIDDQVLQVKMGTYEKGTGAIPPGAKGTVGGGRLQHSTNLKTNKPASYSYANMTTRPDSRWQRCHCP